MQVYSWLYKYVLKFSFDGSSVIYMMQSGKQRYGHYNETTGIMFSRYGHYHEKLPVFCSVGMGTTTKLSVFCSVGMGPNMKLQIIYSVCDKQYFGTAQT